MRPIFKRIFSWALKEISRNKGVFSTTSFILVIGITIFGSLFLLRGLTDFTVNLLESKADITVFFNKDIGEDEILKFKEKISKVPEVKEVDFVSREDALKKFKERHKGESEIMASLEEIGDNPFLPHLNIKAWKASQYDKITNFIEMSSLKDEVNKIDYSQNKLLINRIFSISQNIKVIYTILILVSILLIILVVFNTVRLAIYDLRDEISIMRLVGASNWFIRGPFVAEGIIIGFLTALISIAITGISAYFLSPKISFFVPGFSLFEYFKAHFLFLAGIEILFGIIISAFSSLIAVRKYLKI